MAKNRPKNWPSHLVDFFIFFKNKILLSIFWHNLVGCCETPKYTFSATLVGFMGADWQKSGLNFKKL